VTVISGGAAMDAALARMARGLDRPLKLQVGYPEGETYPDGTPLGLVAAVNNYGAPARGIPPRPFFTDTIKAGESRWPGEIAAIAKAAEYNPGLTLARFGDNVAGQIKEAIGAWEDPPNAESTVARKGFDKPLIDTHLMFDSVKSIVSDT
jgi:hypothetical protein